MNWSKYITKNLLLSSAILLWVVGLNWISDVKNYMYKLCYIAAAFTWLSSEYISLMMGERYHRGLRPAIIVNCHVAMLLWLIQPTAYITNILYSLGCFLAILWGGGLDTNNNG